MTVLDTLQAKHFTWIIYFNPSKEAYKINIYYYLHFRDYIQRLGKNERIHLSLHISVTWGKNPGLVSHYCKPSLCSSWESLISNNNLEDHKWLPS